MSKYTTVKKALEDNPEVVVIASKVQNYFPDRNGNHTQMPDFWVAPKSGLYTRDALQEFMESLVPLQPTMKLNSRVASMDDPCLLFGKLYFDEKIGESTVVTTHTMTDPEFIKLKGNTYTLNDQGVLVISNTADHLRRTVVSPYPNEQFAKDLLEEKVEGYYSARLSVLKHYESAFERPVTYLPGKSQVQ